jgi:hypothetical protein
MDISTGVVAHRYTTRHPGTCALKEEEKNGLDCGCQGGEKIQCSFIF